MSPTHTISAHLGKEILSSWRRARQTSPEPNPFPSPSQGFFSTTAASYFPRPSSPSEKRSMDSDRNSEPSSQQPLARQTSVSSWRWGSR
ncbi:hypothetical protein VTJ04DRAFT_10070 [Mycothermus thermophilus]|uniref:uncharacterized protein n=1 Tax=Humicola insolens TaxID=85995 RepID=UPI0037423870